MPKGWVTTAKNKQNNVVLHIPIELINKFGWKQGDVLLIRKQGKSLQINKTRSKNEH